MGSNLSFNDISDTDGIRKTTKKIDKIVVDKKAMTVTFGAGVTFADLESELTKHGLALEVLPSSSEINVVGSVVTGSHGSG